jgi:hypothetical protein
MPRFYFHVLDDLDTQDDEGAELANVDEARRHATIAARVLMCETLAQEGRITLHHSIEIQDEEHTLVETVYFRQAVRIETEA